MSDSTIEPGYCECGCGTYIGFHARAYHRDGIKKGDPKHFAPRHSRPRSQVQVESAFWAKITKPLGDAGCWEWTGALTKGYGKFYSEGSVTQAHRWAYEALVGPIPEGLQIDHLCRNRKCVNPAHLEPVTSAENTRRGVPYFPKVQQTHCKRGHELSGDNVRLERDGRRRVCRACRREASQRYRDQGKPSKHHPAWAKGSEEG